MFSMQCPDCSHLGRYDIHLLTCDNDFWHLYCSLCGFTILTLNSNEREQIIQGFQLTEQYIPNLKDAYENLDKLSSTFSFRIYQE